jgi:hypothetical protein
MDNSELKKLLKDHLQIVVTEQYIQWDTEITIRLLYDDEVISYDTFVIES